MRFTPTNIADFLVYRYPYLYVVECKSTGGHAIGIQRTPDDAKSMIMAHQISDLINSNLETGVISVLLMNYRDDESIADGRTYALPIDGFSDFLCETDKKSINKLDCVQHGAIVVEQKLKRTHFTYDVGKMLDDLEEKIKLKDNNKKEEINGASL